VHHTSRVKEVIIQIDIPERQRGLCAATDSTHRLEDDCLLDRALPLKLRNPFNLLLSRQSCLLRRRLFICQTWQTRDLGRSSHAVSLLPNALQKS
jgi:hypothetical protein